MAILRHPRPCQERIGKAAVKARKLVRQSRGDPSAGYRRGFADALAWVLGRHVSFDRRFRTRERKVQHGETTESP